MMESLGADRSKGMNMGVGTGSNSRSGGVVDQPGTPEQGEWGSDSQNRLARDFEKNDSMRPTRKEKGKGRGRGFERMY